MDWLRALGVVPTEKDATTSAFTSVDSPVTNNQPRSRRLSGLEKLSAVLKTGSDRILSVGKGRRSSLNESANDDVHDTPGDEGDRNRAFTEQYDFDEVSGANSSVDLPQDLQQVWVPNMPKEPWKLAKVFAVSKDRQRVTVLIPTDDMDGDEAKADQVRSFMRENVRGYDDSHLSSEISDIGSLNDLHEASCLAVIRNRFMCNRIYSRIGSTIIAVNPYQQLPNAFPFPYDSLEPHVFGVANTTLKANTKSHSILINGDSGAGKTESTKQLLRYLSHSQGSKAARPVEIRRMITMTTPLLEAFGNARTCVNSNSSRFGRYVQIHFGADEEIQGSSITHFLLEKGRVTGHGRSERSFHVFYQLCHGLDSRTRESLFLSSDPNEHMYLRGFAFESSMEDDLLAKAFLETSAALECVGISEAERRGIWTALALVLRLGDVTFEPIPGEEADQCRVTNGLKQVSVLAGVDENALAKSLVTRVIESGRSKETTEIPLSAERARDSCAGLAKSIYTLLFDWIVERINASSSGTGHHRSIGVLDMMGFEVLQKNSLEQLLINFASEVLQSVFNEGVLRSEERFYAEEGVVCRQLSLTDSSAVLKLLSQGVLPLLDDAVLLRWTDEQLLRNIYEQHKSNASLSLDPVESSSQFAIQHFAGPVLYSVTGVVEKNSDRSFNLLTRLLATGTGFVTKQLLGDRSQERRRLTISQGFKISLDSMMKQLSATECHFIRCIRPNLRNQASLMDLNFVHDQLLRLGIFEAVRLRREGFPLRVPFTEIVNRYPSLLKERKVSDREACDCIMIEGFGEHLRGVKWELGKKNHVFLSNRAFVELDIEVRRRAAVEEARLAKLTRIERERLAREEQIRLEREAQLRAQEEDRLKREAEMALRLKQLEDERRRLEEEETNRRIAQVKQEELRLRAQREAEEQRRAEEERNRREAAAIRIQATSRGHQQRLAFASLLLAERARRERIARDEQDRRLQLEREQRESRAATTIQRMVRGELIRERFEQMKSRTAAFRRLLRPNELVLKSSLVVRLQVRDMVRAVDAILGANGKVSGVASKASFEVSNPAANRPITLSLNQRRRYSLLLTLRPDGASLLLADLQSMEIVDEMIIGSGKPKGRRKKSTFLGKLASNKDTSDSAHHIRAFSSSTRDFVVAKHKEEWVLTDLMGEAVSWVALLKDDAKRVPTISQALSTNCLREKLGDCTGKLIVRQGRLMLRRRTDNRTTWVRRWVVLDEESVQIFHGKSSAFPVAQLSFDDQVIVSLSPKGEESRPFVFDVRRNSPSESSVAPVHFRFQANSKAECDAWVVALGVSVDRARTTFTENKVSITAKDPSSGDAQLPGLDTTVGRAERTGEPSVLPPFNKLSSSDGNDLGQSKKKKKGFDAAAFKQAFKDADRVTLTNWE